MILSMLFGSAMGSSIEEGSTWRVLPSDSKSQNSEKNSHISGKHDHDSTSLCGTPRAPSLIPETTNRSDRGRRSRIGDGEESLFSIPIQTTTEEQDVRRAAQEKIRFLQETNRSKESQEEELGPEMEKGQLLQERLQLLQEIARLREREEELLIGLNKFRKENDRLQRKLVSELGEIKEYKEKLDSRARVIRDYREKLGFSEEDIGKKKAEIQMLKQEAANLEKEYQQALDKLANEHKQKMAELAEEHKEALGAKDKELKELEHKLAAKEVQIKSIEKLESLEKALSDKLGEKSTLITNQRGSLAAKEAEMKAQRAGAISQYNTHLTQNGKLSFDEYLVALGGGFPVCANFLKAKDEKALMEACHIAAMAIMDVQIQKCRDERNAELARWWIRNHGQLSSIMPSVVINGILDPGTNSPATKDTN